MHYDMYGERYRLTITTSGTLSLCEFLRRFIDDSNEIEWHSLKKCNEWFDIHNDESGYYPLESIHFAHFLDSLQRSSKWSEYTAEDIIREYSKLTKFPESVEYELEIEPIINNQVARLII